jgi:hypothetical protein
MSFNNFFEHIWNSEEIKKKNTFQGKCYLTLSNDILFEKHFMLDVVFCQYPIQNLIFFSPVDFFSNFHFEWRKEKNVNINLRRGSAFTKNERKRNPIRFRSDKDTEQTNKHNEWNRKEGKKWKQNLQTKVHNAYN